MSFFWAYSVAYGMTGDKFVWEIVRSIALGNGLGDLGQTPISGPAPQITTTCSHPYGIFGLLELYRKTDQRGYLDMARRIGDNILKNRFHKGFFVPSEKHFYTRFSCFEPLALLHLEAETKSESVAVPQPWPGLPLFVNKYRYKIQGVDRHVIYSLTESSEPPMSLQEAAAIGDLNLVGAIIDNGANVGDFGNTSYTTALHRAAIEGHKPVAELLLAKGAPVNERDRELETPLIYAVLNSHKGIVELLLAHGADVNSKDKFGRTPLDVVRQNDNAIRKLLLDKAAETSIHAAASLGVLGKVKTFLEDGIDVNAKDSQGMTPLHLAAQGGHKEVVELLVTSGADVNVKDDRGITPLVLAKRRRRIEIIQILIRASEAQTTPDEEVYSPQGQAKGTQKNEQPVDEIDVLNNELRAAVFQGQKERIEELIVRGANVNSEDSRALHIAANQGYKEMVQLLLAHGADINIKDYRGQTPLHRAAEKGHLDVVQLLLKSGADINTKDRNDRTPMDFARKNSHTQIVEILTKKTSLPQGLVKDAQKIEQSEVIREATQLLLAAVKASDIEQVKAYIADGADINAKDATGRMPVHYAVANSRKDIVELLTTAAIQPGSFEDRELTKVKRLLSQGMDVNAQPSRNTLLHYAAQTGYVYVAAYLIAHSANVDAENDSGRTPLNIALQWKEPMIALLLLDAGATATERDRRNNILLQAAQQIGRYGEKRADYENHNRMVESSSGSGSKHDIAISKTSTLNRCIKGDVIPVTVTLDNRGHQEELARVILFDDKSVVAVRQIKLGVSVQNGPEDTPDIVFDPENINRNVLGQRVCIGGDVNGDGFGDVLIGAWEWQNNRGRAYLHFGGPHMDQVADIVFTGIKEGDGFANQSGVFGDVNNDGYDDVIIGAIGNANTIGIQDGYVHVYLGGPRMDNVPDIVLSPSEAGRRGGFGFVASGDVDNDGYCDILVGEPWSKRVSLFWGGDQLSTSTNVVFVGTENAFPFSHRMSIGGDVNGDGYNDIIIGSRESGENKRLENKQGRAYLYLGNTKEQMDTDCDWFFVDETPGSSFGSAVDIFDIDNDGYDDVIIAARYASSLRGRVYVYWGSESFDGSEPGVILEPKEVSGMGEYLQAGHINGDPYGDILVGGWIYPGNQYRHGRAYVFYGNSKDAIDTDCDYIFEGEGRTEDWFGAQLGLGDVNNDGYTDTIVGAWGANHWAGRAYLFYGPFSSTSDITFNWDTTNASIGKHTLKIEIPPVPGEQNTENNIKTMTIEVKEPRR
jgi:ankyrin repeat protein